MGKARKRKRRRPIEIRPWTGREVQKLVSEYEAGKTRGELQVIFGRTQGSVSNKIRLLVKARILKPRR